MPRISIIMPAYNAQATIEASIDSVLRQTCTEYELIIVDDGSSDATTALIAHKQNAPGGTAIRALRQRNQGTAAAQNTGFAQATGEYIALLDADDLWHETKLERQLSYLEQHPKVGVCYCDSRFMNAAGELLNRGQKPRRTGVTVKDVLCRHPVSNGSTALMRRAVLEALRLPDGSYADARLGNCHDIEFWVRAALRSPLRFEGLPEILTYYRLSAQGYSAALEDKRHMYDHMLTAISTYAPELVQQWGALARAYHLRYLARRAIAMGDGRASLAYALSALHAGPRMVWEEPLRTLETLAAAGLLRVLPSLKLLERLKQ